MRPTTVALSLIGCLFTSWAAALPPRWEPATPNGARMRAIAQSATVPSTLYASTALGAVLRTIDGGAHWTRVRGLGTFGPVDEFLVSPRDPRLVFARSPYGLWRSRDGGRAWQILGAGTLPGVDAAALDAAGTTLYVGTGRGVYRSLDDGDHWASVDGLASGVVLAVAVDPANPDRLFAALNGIEDCPPTTILRSLDRGATWTQVLSQAQTCIRETPVFLFDRSRSEVVYLLFRADGDGGPPGAQRSLDGGLTWSPLANMFWTRDLASGADGRLYAGTLFGVATSADAGTTWTPRLGVPLAQTRPPYDSIERLLVSSGDADRLYAAGDSGIWISRRGGTAWREANIGVTSLAVGSVAAAPTAPPAVFAVSSPGFFNDLGSSLFRSGDAGDHWLRVHQALQGLQPDRLLAFDPRDARRIFGFTFDGDVDKLLRSGDGGQSWQLLPVGFDCSGDSVCSEEMPAFAIDPSNPDSMLLGIFYFAHFHGIDEPLMRSTDGGDSWSEITSVPSLRALAIDPDDSSHVWALACDHLLESHDTGTTWLPIGTGLPSVMCDGGAAVSLAVSNANEPTAIYAGISGHGVFASTNGGASFHRLGSPAIADGLATLLIDPAEPGALYLGAAHRGVFRFDPQRNKWLALNLGLSIPDFLGIVAVDPQEPTQLFAATEQHGLFRLRVAAGSAAISSSAE